MADLKNLMLSGDLSGSRVVHIERLQINVTHAGRDVITLNAADFEGLPIGTREALLSLRGKLPSKGGLEVIHGSE